MRATTTTPTKAAIDKQSGTADKGILQKALCSGYLTSPGCFHN